MASIYIYIYHVPSGKKNFTFYMTRCVVDISICDVLTEKTINSEVFEKWGSQNGLKQKNCAKFKMCKDGCTITSMRFGIVFLHSAEIRATPFNKVPKKVHFSIRGRTCGLRLL